MNGLDFFLYPSPTVNPSAGNNGEDDDWGEFVDSSPNQNGFFPDRNGVESTPNQIQSEKKSQAQWITSGGPVPLSVFGEEEEEEEKSGAPVSSFKFSLDSVNTNPTVEIKGLIADLYREKGHKESLSNLDTERSEKTSSVVNSTYSDDEGWEFKTAESMFPSADRSSKEEDDAKNGPVVVQSTTYLDSGMWSSPTTGTSSRDDDHWGNGEWDFKVAETREPKKDLTNKESNGWGFGFAFEHVSEIETTTSNLSTLEKDPQEKVNFCDADVISGGASWAFNQPTLESGNEKEEKEVHIEKPKGVLPLSFFEDDSLETSGTLVHEDNLVSVCDFSVREKAKVPSPTVSISDLISSLYSQVEEKNAANLSEKSPTEPNFVNGEDDSWEFQGPAKNIIDPSIADGGDDFDTTWEFQGHSPPLENSDVVDEFDDGSWEFQSPTQLANVYTSRKGESDSWEHKHSSMENELNNLSYIPNGFPESLKKQVTSIELNDYQVVFHKLKTELYYLALNHLETLKEARNLAADSDEVVEAEKGDSEIQDLQNLLSNDNLIGEVNVESLQSRSSGITELYKALQEPKFRAVDSEDLLSERLLLAEKNWKSTSELLKHATLSLKVLNLGSHEQHSKYTSTWSVIATTCAQELQHAASIWKQVIENDVQEEILSKPQGKSYVLSVGEIYRVVKILRASTSLYKPWVLLSPTSSNVLAVLDMCVELWLSSGLEEALSNNINRHQGPDCDDSADHQLLESIKRIEEVDAFTLHACITSATSPTCYISGLNAEIVPRIEMVEWNGEHYLAPLANLWANLISRDPPDLPSHCFLTVS